MATNNAINDGLPIDVTSGGTGLATLTQHAVMLGEATSNVGFVGPLTDGQLVIGSTGNDPAAATLTAGTNISITNAAGSITINSASTLVLTYSNVAATPYVVTATDTYLSVDTSALAITIKLPNAPTANRVFVIKDRTGNANIRNISVTTIGGVVTIDGVATYTMNTAFAAISLLYNGSTYEIY